MSKIIAYLIAFLITCPIIATVIIYFILNYFIKPRKKVIHKCMEYTAFIYLLSTIIIFNVIFKINLIGPMVLLLLVIFFALIFIQWRLIRDVKIVRLWKIYLRFVFLLFFTANFILTCVSIYSLAIN
ncbi:MAG: DUF3397 domain-containing protein [Amphibacillus sp.]|nr:DUF3397 domain-containing protein [Amphibacillus sp.]